MIGRRRHGRWLLIVVVLCTLTQVSTAWGQSVSGVRAFGGGVAPLFNLTGPGNYYTDAQGTQGFIYNFGTFESYSFRNPATGQAWTGALGTLGPQLTIGLIQGANQIGAPLVLPPSPRDVPPLLPLQSSLFDDVP